MPGSQFLRILTSMALLLPGVVRAAPELSGLQQRVSVENAE